MKALHIDVKTGQEIQSPRAGIAAFCSWRRFPEVLRHGGQMTDKENLASIEIDERGITFRFES